MDKMRRYLIFLCLSISLAGCRTAAPAEDTLEATNTSSAAGTPATAESSSAVESSVTAETPAAADSTITFPPAGEMLEVECEPFAPLDDDGSREVTVQYYFADGTEVSASYDLSAGETRDEAEEPVITIQRDWSTGAGVMHTSAPVTAQEDRDWILDAISSADFQPMRELPGYGNLVLFVEEDGETVSYGICSDGTLFWEDANGNAEFAAEALDYLKLSALTYKYAGRASDIGGYLPEGWLLSVQLEQRAEIPEEIAAVWDDYPAPPASHYRLCLQGEDFHIDLDREQAQILLETLFGQGDTGNISVPDFVPAGFDWTPDEEGIRLTEYLYTLGTSYESREDGPAVLQQTFYLYPDGTIARIPLASPIWNYQNEMESLTPSRERAAVAEAAFLPDDLNLIPY